MRMTRPKAIPIRTCWQVSHRAVKEPVGNEGIGASVGATATVADAATPILTRMGMEDSPNAGATVTRARIRKNGQRKAFIQSYSRPMSNVTILIPMRSRSHFRDLREQRLDVIHHGAYEPGAEQCQGCTDSQQFGNEG